MRNKTTWFNLLFILLLAFTASGVVSAKVVSGPQNLSAELNQGQSPFNLLLHQGKSQSSYDDASGSSVATKGAASFGQIKTALTSAQQAYKGSTVVGHALSKHAGRNPDIWGKTTGSMKTWNDQAMKHFRDIAKGPGEFQKVTEKGVSFMEKRLSDGRGMRLNMDSTFKGFID